jgi:hypothetical protein
MNCNDAVRTQILTSQHGKANIKHKALLLSSLALLSYCLIAPPLAQAQIVLAPEQNEQLSFDRGEYQNFYADNKSTVSTVRPVVIGRFTFDSLFESNSRQKSLTDIFNPKEWLDRR